MMHALQNELNDGAADNMQKAPSKTASPKFQPNENNGAPITINDNSKVGSMYAVCHANYGAPH